MVTMEHIARQLDVSRSTVSYVLNNRWQDKGISRRTRDAILAKARQLNYRRNLLATGLKTRVTNTIGVVVPTLFGEMYGTMQAGIRDVLGETYTLLSGSAEYDPRAEKRVLERLSDRMVDGLVVVSNGGDEVLDTLKSLARTGVPLVQADRYHPGVASDIVEADNPSLTRMQVDHLVAQGHRWIAFVRQGNVNSTTVARERGYVEAMKAHGLTPILPDAAATNVPVAQRGDWACQQTMELFSKMERPTALVTHVGTTAVGALQAVEKLGLRCPQDVSITTVQSREGQRPDDYLLRLRFTAVQWSVFDLGREAALCLKSRWRSGAGQPRHVKLPGRLIEGDTTAPPPH